VSAPHPGSTDAALPPGYRGILALRALRLGALITCAALLGLLCAWRQEISLLSLKDDITEELDRLDTHLQAIDDALAAGSPVGKRLDFLMQELNREANTIASKSIALSITDTALALKLLIEQLREQVQNLE